jgi:hypothetical protein
MLRFMGWALCGVLVLTILESTASAAISASATVSSQQLGPNSYRYSISVTNTGDTTIKTYWFGWIAYLGAYPYDFLPHQPTAVGSPSGWIGTAPNDSPYTPGYYAGEWTSPAGIAAGATLTGFTFDSPDAPTTIGGTSQFAGYPVRESWVYQNVYTTINGSGANAEFTPTLLVPEPFSVLLLPAGLLMLRRRGR